MTVQQQKSQRHHRGPQDDHMKHHPQVDMRPHRCLHDDHMKQHPQIDMRPHRCLHDDHRKQHTQADMRPPAGGPSISEGRATIADFHPAESRFTHAYSG